MAVRLVFIGKLADLAGENERIVPGPMGWADLAERLGAELAQAIADERVRVAVNGTLLADKTRLDAQAGDEVAFLPPVSGG